MRARNQIAETQELKTERRLLSSWRWAALFSLLTLLSPAALAVEYLSNEQPTPSSVAESETPIEQSFRPSEPAAGPLTALKKELADQTPFLRDTRLGIHLRTYEFYQDNGKNQYEQAWTLGGDLDYKSGYFLDRLAVGSVLYTSQPLYAPEDQDGTDLLKTEQRQITVVGQLYAELKIASGTLVNLYRKAYNTPYINKDDSRMVPNTFEGYTFLGQVPGALDLHYGGGYIDRIKERNSDQFIWMSRSAGASVNRGVYLAGGNVAHGNFFMGGVDYYSQDIINIAYAEAKYETKPLEAVELGLSAQFTHQQSVGEDLLTGKTFATNQAGVQAQASHRGAVLTLGYTNNGNGTDLQAPWSGYPGFTSVQVNNFNLAGEQALLSGLSYDLVHLGLHGVNISALFVHGWSRVNPGSSQSAAQQNEFNADMQWQPRWATENLWLRLRYANAANYGPNSLTTNEIRFIANYKFSVL